MEANEVNKCSVLVLVLACSVWSTSAGMRDVKDYMWTQVVWKYDLEAPFGEVQVVASRPNNTEEVYTALEVSYLNQSVSFDESQLRGVGFHSSPNVYTVAGTDAREFRLMFEYGLPRNVCYGGEDICDNLRSIILMKFFDDGEFELVDIPAEETSCHPALFDGANLCSNRQRP